MTAQATTRYTSKPAPYFRSKLLPKHFKNYFYFRSQYFNFEAVVRDVIDYKTPNTAPAVESLGQLSEKLRSWNLLNTPSATRERGYQYDLRFSEYQAKECIKDDFNGVWPAWANLTPEQQGAVKGLFPRTLTLCQSPAEFYERLKTTEFPYWYNPARSGKLQTVREFCYHNGFLAAANLKVKDGERVLEVLKDSTLHTDSWLQGDKILTWNTPILCGLNPEQPGNWIGISFDAVILED